MGVKQHQVHVVGRGGNGEGVGEVVGGEVGVEAQVGVEGNGRGRGGVGGETSDEDVEEEDVRFRNGEEEGTRVARGAKLEQLLCELGDGGEVRIDAIENELSVGLSQVREGAGFVDEADQRVAAQGVQGHLHHAHQPHFYSLHIYVFEFVLGCTAITTG